MGFSTTIATVIIALSIIVMAVVFIPAFESYVFGMSDSLNVQREFMAEQQETALSVESITVTGRCALYNLSILVRNTGSRPLDNTKTTIIDNGLYLNQSATGMLPPTKSINMVYESLTTADVDHTIRMTSANGASAYGAYNCS